PRGVLRLTDTAASDHIASPDVHLDHDRRLVRMYFHEGRADAEQASFLATSTDGLDFTASPQALAPFYLRVFEHDGWHYGIAKVDNKSGVILRSRSADGTGPFEPGRKIIPRMRHAAVLVRGSTAWLFYSRIGDAPECLLSARLDLDRDWTRWRPKD